MTNATFDWRRPFLAEGIMIMEKIDIDLEVYEQMVLNRSVDILTLIADSLPVFSEDERLSTFEFGEVEEWPASIVQCLLNSKDAKSEKQRKFFACAEGLRKRGIGPQGEVQHFPRDFTRRMPLIHH